MLIMFTTIKTISVYPLVMFTLFKKNFNFETCSWLQVIKIMLMVNTTALHIYKLFPAEHTSYFG